MTNEFDTIAFRKRLNAADARYTEALNEYRRTSSHIIVMMTVAIFVVAALAVALVRADRFYADQDKVNQERVVKW